MDFPLYLRTAWRHKIVVCVGLFLAVALGVLVAKSAKPVWQVQASIFVTQDGFPWGRAIVNTPLPQAPAATSALYGPPTADPNRFVNLAILYSHLANGDPVRKIMLEEGPIDGKYEAAAVPSDDGNGYIPFINITAQAGTAKGVSELALRAATAFRTYLEGQQKLNRIPLQNRVQLPIVSYPTKPLIISGKSLTRPVFVFLLAAIATMGFALALERLRPGDEPVAAEAAAPAPALNGSGPEPLRTPSHHVQPAGRAPGP
jgi:hypothetical protein